VLPVILSSECGVLPETRNSISTVEVTAENKGNNLPEHLHGGDQARHALKTTPPSKVIIIPTH
jgi:hypothetical protein